MRYQPRHRRREPSRIRTLGVPAATALVATGTPPLTASAQAAPPGELKPLTASATVQTGYTTVALNVRTGPSTRYARVAVLPPGTRVATGSVRAGWVKLTDGRYAGRYVSAQYVRFDASEHRASRTSGRTYTRYTMGSRSTSQGVVVRQRASTRSAAAGVLTGGQRVRGSYVKKGWFRISSGPYAGRYLNAGVLTSISDTKKVNGRKPRAELCAMPRANQAPGYRQVTLDCSALASFKEMDAAFYRQFGYHLRVLDGYRDIERQRDGARRFGFPRAAIPGTSNHGWGLSIDLYGNGFRFGTAADRWLTRYGAAYGWDRPSFLDRTGSNPEYWHYNFTG